MCTDDVSRCIFFGSWVTLGQMSPNLSERQLPLHDFCYMKTCVRLTRNTICVGERPHPPVYSGTAGDDPRLTSFLWHWWLAQGRMGTGFWLAPWWLGRHLAACKTQEGNSFILRTDTATTETKMQLTAHSRDHKGREESSESKGLLLSPVIWSK